jgi:hypothetical protein
MSKKRASPAPCESVCSLAGEIARNVNDRWCGWHVDTGCVRWRVGTSRRTKTGRRYWVAIGGASVEFLELLLTLDFDSRHRAVERLVGQLRRFVDDNVKDVP